MWKWLVGWHVLLVIVVAVVVAEALSAHRFIKRGLWTVAAAAAVVGAIQAWRRS